MKEDRFRLEIRKIFFMINVVRNWNGLPEEAVDTPSQEVFRSRVGRGFEQPNLVKYVPTYGGGVGLGDL